MFGDSENMAISGRRYVEGEEAIPPADGSPQLQLSLQSTATRLYQAYVDNTAFT